MRLGLFLGLLVVVSSAVACAPKPPSSEVDLNDPAWIPPGQGDLAIGDDPEPKAAKARKPRHLEQPNKADVPAHAIQAKNP